MMKRIVFIGAILLGQLMSIHAMAANDEAASAIARRRAVFKLISFSNDPLGTMAKGGEYDADVATLGVKRVAMLADLIPEVFETDTTGVVIPGRYIAADTVWTSKDDFDQLAADLAAGANAALEILNTQGASGVRAAVREIGPKCGACHDRYRIEQ